MPKKADLGEFQVKKNPVPLPEVNELRGREDKNHFITKGFRITPEAARQFDMLKVEIGTGGKDAGPSLIAEALNLLFQKYKKPPIA